MAKHPEIWGQEVAAVATLENPLAIYQDAKHPERHVYYRPGVLKDDFAKGYLRIVVAFKGKGKRGYLVSAHGAFGPKKGEVLIWPQS